MISLLQVPSWILDETIFLLVVLVAGLVVFSVLDGVIRRVFAWLRPPADRTSGSKPHPPVWMSMTVVWTLASLVPLLLLTVNVVYLHLIDGLAMWLVIMWLVITAVTAWPLVFFVGLDARRIRKRGGQSRYTGEKSVFELLYLGLNTKARRERAAEFKRSRPLAFWTVRTGYTGGFLVPHLAVVVATWYLLWARPRALRAERRHLTAKEPKSSAKASKRKRTSRASNPTADSPHPAKADGRSATTSAPTRPPVTDEATTEPTPDDLYGRVIRMREQGERAAEAGRYDDALGAWRQAIDLCERAARLADDSEVVDDFRRLRTRLEVNVGATERRKAASELDAAETAALDALAAADGLLADESFADAVAGYERAKEALVRLGALGAADIGCEPTVDVEASLERVERGRVEATVGSFESRVAQAETMLDAGDADGAIAVFERVLDDVDRLADSDADSRLASLADRAAVGRITAAARNQIDAMVEAEELFNRGNPFEAREHYRRIESAVTALVPSVRASPDVLTELRAIADACEWNVDVTRRAIWEDDDRALVTAEDVRNGWRPPAPKTTIDAVMATLEGYSLTGQLGGGGFADVYEVRADDGSRAALKVPRLQFDETVPESKLRLFDAEAENWRTVSDHPNVVDVLGYGDKPVPWLLLERCTASLRGRLENITSAEALAVLAGVGGALDHANGKGIVHLDVKPENVLFDAEGVAKLGDWGLSKVVVDGTITTPGLSNRYAAPEQLDRTLGERNVRTDVYQYGVLAYELLTGKHPFDVGSRDTVVPPSQVHSDLPESVDAALLKALAPRQVDRFEQVVQVRDALVEALEVDV